MMIEIHRPVQRRHTANIPRLSHIDLDFDLGSHKRRNANEATDQGHKQADARQGIGHKAPERIVEC